MSWKGKVRGGYAVYCAHCSQQLEAWEDDKPLSKRAAELVFRTYGWRKLKNKWCCRHCAADRKGRRR